MRRWEALDGFAKSNHLWEVFDQAEALCASDRAEDRVLGAEIMDGLLTSGRVDHARAEAVLEPLCEPDQNPDVLAAALGPYRMTGATPEELAFELLGHPHPAVRETAIRVLGDGDDDPETAQRTTSAIVALLDEDPEPLVRVAAAEHLAILYGEYDAPYSETIREALARHLDDRLPAVRSRALEMLMSSARSEPGTFLERLRSELASPDVHPSFVRLSSSATRRIKIPKDVRRDLYDALVILRDTGWSERAAPGEYPRHTERRDMLADATKSLRGPRLWPR
jgi:hypothetical protein